MYQFHRIIEESDFNLLIFAQNDENMQSKRSLY